MSKNNVDSIIADASGDKIASSSYGGPIFDGDSHFYETSDAFTRHFPAKYKKDWSFQFKTGEDGDYALYIGKRKVNVGVGYFTADGKVPAPGRLHEWLRAMKAGDDKGGWHIEQTPDMYQLDPRIKKMDEFGVDGAIIYLGHMISGISFLDDPKVAHAIIHGYNQWLLEDWTFNYQDRLFSTPIVTLADLDLACNEAKWLAKNGAKLIMMPMGPCNKRPPAHPDNDPFWSILNEAGIGVVYHVGEAIYMKDHMAVWGEKVQQSRLLQSPFVWMHGYSERPVVESLSSMIFLNFFERFPNIRVLSAENGATWVPSMLSKMDTVRGMAKNGYWACGQLKDRPSRIFKRHVWVVAYPEDNLQRIIDDAGGDSNWLVMGSDYPHAEGVPTPKDFFHEACDGLSERQVQGIMHDNGWRFITGY